MGDTPQPPTPQNPTSTNTGTAEFSQVVQESQAAIQAQASEPPKIKRGRGRPQGSRRPRGDQVSGTPGGTSPGTAQTTPGSVPGASPDITKFLMAPLKAVSKIPANNYKLPELALSDDEAFACAYSLQQCFEAFAPHGQMNPKTAAILGALATFGSIGFAKYQVLQDHLSKIKPPTEPEPEKIDPFQPFPVSAVDAFRKPQVTQ